MYVFLLIFGILYVIFLYYMTTLCNLISFIFTVHFILRKSMEPVDTWSNPVVERLTGIGNSNNYNPGLRNESYYMVNRL